MSIHVCFDNKLWLKLLIKCPKILIKINRFFKKKTSNFFSNTGWSGFLMVTTIKDYSNKFIIYLTRHNAGNRIMITIRVSHQSWNGMKLSRTQFIIVIDSSFVWIMVRLDLRMIYSLAQSVSSISTTSG